MQVNQAEKPVTVEPDKKYFTLEEANRALPYITRVIEDVMACYAEIVELRQIIEHDDDDSRVDEAERDYEKQMDRLGELVDELHVTGVELKDFERGLIDFPSVHNDREVLLCWKHGESGVDHWHEVDAGFGGRQSVAHL